MSLRFDRAEYVRSAGSPDQFLRDGLPQFVFAGRSNVGKSSVINRLLNRKNLARVGASPGKTRQINYFLVDGRAYLVDLPGYGYAKVPQAEKERWGRLMEAYFRREGDRITAGVLIVDARHKPTEDDCTMHRWFVDTGCREIVLANKLDKLKKSQIAPCLDVIRETLALSDGVLSMDTLSGVLSMDTLSGVLSTDKQADALSTDKQADALSTDGLSGDLSGGPLPDRVLLPFSAEKGTGREELAAMLDALAENTPQ